MTRKTNKWIRLFTALLILICASAAKAQDELTTLRVSTFARNASFIDKEDSLKFSVLEGDDEILPESIEVKPIKQVILAIDNSKSMKYLLSALADNLEKCLGDEIKMPTMIAAFNERVEPMTGFTTSKSELKDAFKKIRLSNKNTKLFETIKDFEKISEDKLTHLILITDGADTSETTINIKEMLAKTNLTISYLNWGVGNPSLLIDEPGYEPNGKSRMVKLNPNFTLSTIAQRSGGDVLNYTDWKTLKVYVASQLSSCSYLYNLFWHTDNPARKYRFSRSKKLGNGKA